MFHPLQNRSFFLTFNCRIAAFWPSWDTTNARWFLDFPQNHSQDLTILLKSLAALSQFLSASLSLSQPLSASLNPLSTLSQPLSGSLGDYRPHNHHQSPRAVSEARRARQYVQLHQRFFGYHHHHHQHRAMLIFMIIRRLHETVISCIYALETETRFPFLAKTGFSFY